MDSNTTLSTQTQAEKENGAKVHRLAGILAIILFAYEYAQMVLLNNLYEILSTSFSLDKLEMGYLSMSYYLGMLIMYPTVGWSVHRYAPAKVLCISLLGVILGALAFALSGSFEQLIISRFVQGIFAAFTYVSCLLVATSSYPKSMHAMITGYVFAAGALGGSLSQILGQVAIASLGWRHAMYANIIVGFLLTLPYIIYCIRLRDKPVNNSQESIFSLMKKALEDIRVWCCAGIAASLNISLVAMGAIYGSTYLQHVHALGPEQAASICGLLYVGVIAGSVFWGKLSWYMKTEIYAIFAGSMGAILALISLATERQVPINNLGIYFIIIGIFCSAQAQVYPYIARLLPKMIIGAAKATIVMGVIGAATMLPWALTHVHTWIQVLQSASVTTELTSIILPGLIVINLLGGVCAIKLAQNQTADSYTKESLA